MDRWRRAVAELRAHPARFGATALAITLAVAFLVGTQVFLGTERAAVAAREALFASCADVVVETYLWRGGLNDHRRDGALDLAEEYARANPDVVTTSRFSQVYSQAQAGDRVVGIEISSVPEPELRWMEPIAGRLPEADQEIALSRPAADRLGVGIGDEVRLNSSFLEPFTVVGVTPERGFTDAPAYLTLESLFLVGASLPPPDHLLLVDPAFTRRTTPGSSGDGIGVRLLVKTRPGTAQAVRDTLATQLYDEGVMRIYAQARTVDEIRALEAEARRGVPDPLGALVGAGAGLALATGALIVAVTFGVLATQRRRQVGLLRAVGATRAQALGQLLGEALLVGLAASLLGGLLGIAGAATGAAASGSC